MCISYWGKSLRRKALRIGYYCSTVKEDPFRRPLNGWMIWLRILIYSEVFYHFVVRFAPKIQNRCGSSGVCCCLAMGAITRDNSFIRGQDEYMKSIFHSCILESLSPSSDKPCMIADVEPSPVHCFRNLRYILYLGEGW